MGADSGKGTEGSENALLEDIRMNVAARNFMYNDNTVLRLTVTIGAARYQSGQTVEEWINIADNRLYNGKQTGKNRVISGDD